MSVRVPADACLDELDSFLRRIWLKCCRHPSAFTISGKRYTFSSEGIYGDTPGDAPDRQIVLSRKVFRYEYDFGTPTGLNLRVTASLMHGERGNGSNCSRTTIRRKSSATAAARVRPLRTRPAPGCAGTAVSDLATGATGNVTE